jgi:predicted MFS family arabinose efflux permease
MDFTVAIMLGVSSLFIVAAVVVGRLINRVGAKKLAAGSLLVSGVLTAAFFLAPNLWVALALNFIQAGFFAAGGTAFSCLILDQVPQSRGTMLSLNTVCGSIGAAIGTAVGGALLVLISYQAVGFAFAAFCVAATIIYYFLTKDPNRK